MMRPPPACRRTVIDGARFAGIGQLEIAGLQILDGPRLRVGDDDIEGDRSSVGGAALNAPVLKAEHGDQPCAKRRVTTRPRRRSRLIWR